MTEKEKEFHDLLENADHERVETYLNVFDRVLLYTIASKLVPKEAVEFSLQIWDGIIKKGIDIDTTKRTNYLEETIVGRSAKLRNEPDGEDLRLHCLKQFEIAKSMIENNLRLNKQEDETDEDFESENSGMD